MPLLQNFSPAEYQNKGKIWDIYSAENGIVYMAADRGLLEYDGKTWNSFKGSEGFTRSLVVVNDSLIYTGSDLDFGVWKKNKYQAFEYTSLYPFREDISDINEEFWNVHKVKDNIIFTSFFNIYVYKNQQLTKISAPNRFTGSYSVDDSLYFADEKEGLFIFNELSLKQVFNYPDDKNFQISGMCHYDGGIVIVTRKSGLFFYSSGNISVFNNKLSQNLKMANVFSFEQINSTYLAFGTVFRGLYITDLDGKIIHHINKQKGLPNNTVLSLHYCPSGKLWMGLDYGISALNLKSNLTYFYDYRGDFGTGHTALLKDDIFYLGTNQGLYTSGWDDLNNDVDFNRFQLISGTEGQVWTLRNIDNSIFIGHDHGLFILKENTIQKLGNQAGVWTILPYKDYLLTGNYYGISIFKKSINKWTFLKNMELILGSCNQLIIENDNILWVNIPNFGIIRAILDHNLYPSERLIFPEKDFTGNYPYLIMDNSGVHVITDKFKYTYNKIDEDFSQQVEINNYPKVEGLLSGVYIADSISRDYEFYSVYNGFALKYHNSLEEESSLTHTLILRKIEAFNNEGKSLLYPDAIVPFNLNNFLIEYIVPNQDDVLYQYKLNESEKWSSWGTNNAFEFLNLKEGKYTLRVRANANGEVTEPIDVSFRIAPPWYRSWYAYVFYISILVFIAYLIRSWQKLLLKKQKKSLLIKQKNSLREQAEKHQQKILLLEQERLKIENNQIKQQLKSKTIELASKAKESEDKNRLLLTLKEKFDNAQKDPNLSNFRWGEIRRLLDSYLKTEDKTFEIQIDELHQDFFKRLKERFPDLSINDLRLCAYLKIGLNSKEISDLLNIQPSSAYISRSRLRKKLNLKVDEDLHDFLINI